MKKILVMLMVLLAGSVNALPYCSGIHTWHNVYAKNGQWKLTLQAINQEASFADSTCNSVKGALLDSESPFVYGFGFSQDADFDIAYTLTAVQQGPAFESRVCVFVISAKGPAQPDITALSYHGAECEWKKIPGVGEDFFVG
ncbi:hypothetical protein [Legionella worsleiensis]|uniref:Uncharacterized protein n=1 Tax=Legionella worsleiensis TaxID=45076 RepID=A0A0W1AF46_9GAMM|nr:hypothetical protein [Legionella worsleiensis]KTD79912.1 hypothetical protein Lwor_1426 [Legionella worsleiensis]STY32425.1 Uncharacterised protein [Legionella worsleiensis]